MSTQPSKPPAILRSPNPLGVGVSRFEVKNLDQRWYTDVYHYMLAITWRLGPRVLTSGFRATDHAAHRRLAAAISSRLPVVTP